MIENNLAKELRAFIKEVVKDFRLPVESGEYVFREPKVINGYLPPKRSKAEDDFPFVLVRVDSSSSTPERTLVKVSIIIGCFSEEYDGHEICWNVYSRIRNALMSMKNNILANKYILRQMVEGATVPEQPYPQWQLDVSTEWEFNSPQAAFDE